VKTPFFYLNLILYASTVTPIAPVLLGKVHLALTLETDIDV